MDSRERLRQLRNGIIEDSAYLRGLTEGWNLGLTEDTTQIEQIKRLRIQQIEKARRERRELTQ